MVQSIEYEAQFRVIFNLLFSNTPGRRRRRKDRDRIKKLFFGMDGIKVYVSYQSMRKFHFVTH